MGHSLINPNQIREYGVPVYDDPYNKNQFGIEGHEAFIPFNTKGTIVYFESRVPTEWESRNLPILLLAGKQWDPVGVKLGPGGGSREMAELKTIRSLHSGIPKQQLAALRQQQDSVEHWGQVKMEMYKVSPTLEPRTFCNRLIEAVNVATAYRDDINDAIDRQKASSIATDRH